MTRSRSKAVTEHQPDRAPEPSTRTATGRFAILGLAVVAVMVAALVVDPKGGDPRATRPVDTQSVAAQPSTDTAEDFCTAFPRLQEAVGKFAALEDIPVQELQDEARNVQQVASNTVMPRTASAGLAYVLGLILDLDETDGPNDLFSTDYEAGIEDNANAADFASWLSEACPVSNPGSGATTPAPTL